MKKLKISIVLCILISMIFSPLALAAEIPEKFDLRDYFNLTVKNQHTYGLCTNEAQSTAIESYVKLKLKNGELEDFPYNPVFSVLALSKEYSPFSHAIPVEFIDAIIRDYYDGEVTSEQEAIRLQKAEGDEFFLELKKVISEYNVYDHNGRAGKFQYLDDIEKTVEGDVITYTDNNFTLELSEEEVQRRRDAIKETIMNNGAVVTTCYGSQIYWTTSPEDGETINLLNQKNDYTSDHSVAIIGWDDNFSRMNFPEEIRPINDGAYIVQNSWGDEWGRHGIFYASYEDVSIEDSLYYVYDFGPFVDENPPSIIDEKADGVWNITVTDNYESGVSKMQYIWTEHNIDPSLDDERWVSFDYTVSVPDIQGKYIWVYTEDGAGNGVLKSLKYNTNDIRSVLRDSERNRVLVRGVEKEEVFLYCETLTQRQLWENFRRDNMGTLIYPLYTPGEHHIYVSKLVDVDGEILESRAKEIVLNIADPWAEEENPEENETNNPEVNDPEVNDTEGNNTIENNTENENTKKDNKEDNNVENDNENPNIDDEQNDVNDNRSISEVRNNTNNKVNNNTKDNTVVVDTNEPKEVAQNKENKKVDVKPASNVVKNESIEEKKDALPQTGENNNAGTIAIIIAASTVVAAGIAVTAVKIIKNGKD